MGYVFLGKFPPTLADRQDGSHLYLSIGGLDKSNVRGSAMSIVQGAVFFVSNNSGRETFWPVVTKIAFWRFFWPEENLAKVWESTQVLSPAKLGRKTWSLPWNSGFYSKSPKLDTIHHFFLAFLGCPLFWDITLTLYYIPYHFSLMKHLFPSLNYPYSLS